MRCKPLIYWDKFRVTLEWNHSDGLRTDDVASLRAINARQPLGTMQEACTTK